MNIINFRSLKVKILMPVIIIAVLGFAAVAVIGYINASKIITENIEQISLGKVENTIAHIDGMLSTWKSEIETLSRVDSVKRMDFEGLKIFVSENKDIFDGYEMFLISDKEGNYKATLGSDGNIADRAYFSAAMKGETVVSDPVTSRATGKPIIVIATPIKDGSGNIIGLTAGTMELSYLADIVDSQRFGNTGYAYMINKEGLVMAHPQKDKIFKENLLENDSKSLVDIIRQMTNGETGTGYYTYEGLKKVVGYSVVKSSGWPIAMTIEYKEVSRDIESLRNSSLLIGLLVVVIMSVIAAMVISRLIKPVLKMANIAKEVSTGNLAVKIDAAGNDEVGILAQSFNDMIHKMRGLITEVRDMSTTVASSAEEMMASSEEVSRVSEQVAIAISELAKGASEQAISTEKGNLMIKEIVEGLSQINEDMVDSGKLAEKAREAVNTGEKSVQYQEASMHENKTLSSNVGNAISSLSEKSKEIGQIIEVIKGIADQTNLLSLNAAIEAARAGEQGRGFAVVAEEVRKLAEQSSSSVKRIGQIISEVQSGVEQAVTEMNRSEKAVEEQETALSETVKAFKDISQAVASITSSIKTVAQASSSLSQNAAQAADSITDIASISEEAASSTEEVAASTEEQTSALHQIADSAESLAELANKLQDSIKRFSV